MLITPPMQLLSMLVFKEKTDAVISCLAHLGVFQPIDPRHIEKELSKLPPLAFNEENNQWQEIEQRLSRILRKLGQDSGPVQSNESFTAEKLKEYFTGLEEKIDILTAEREKLRQELRTKELMLSQVTDFIPFPLKKSSLHTFLEVKLGKLEEKNIVLLEKKLKGIPYVVYPFKNDGSKLIVLLIGLKRDRAFFDNALKDIAWQRMEFPQLETNLTEDVQRQLKNQIEEHRVKITDTNAAIEKLAQHHHLKLSRIQSFAALKKALIEAKKFFCSTERLVLICGWVPQEEKERVADEVKKITKVSYIEKKAPHELVIAKEDIPVRMFHSRIFRPFELLVTTYGVPRYGAIDPTIFIAMTFLVMFGAMFGDLGQGLIFVSVGYILRKSKKINLKESATLLLYCGLSSSVFGLLYGTVFGFEGLIPALWIKPMENVSQLFNAGITFGIVIILIGIIVNIINALRDKDYIKALFDKAGLIAGIVYLTAIGCVTRLFVAKTKIPHFYIILIFFGLILLFTKPFIEIFFKKDKESESFFVSFMEGLVDILEIVMGYLANTVSFIRVAAFSLAHVGLFLAIFELSRLLKDVGSGSVSLLVIILGNILIMLLEGMVVTIQSLRLNYYEFFSKFFMYGKQFYKPLTMGNR